jgi:hypothetical protein
MTRSLLLALLLTLVAASAATAAPRSPTTDPFYVAPADLAAQPPGTILRSREVSLSAGPLPLTGAAGKGYQLAYRTNDAHDRAVVGVTTIIVPSGPAPAGGRNLVSLQDAEDSVDPDCAPSYQLQKGAPDSANLVIESTILVASQLAQGNVLAIPDHEGPRSEYIVTGMEGHAVLDGIRAAQRFTPLGLRGAGTPVALVGYSGGAHATAAANELHPSYAPELKLAAVAAGGVPVGDQETVAHLDGSLGSGALMALSIAMDREYPELGLASLLNDAGRAFHAEALKGCASSVLARPFAHMDDWTTMPNAFALPHVAAVIERNALGHATPTAPSFYYNGIGDELISIKALDKLVAKYCAGGATMRYFRDPLGIEHIQALITFAPLALAFISDRFAGRAAPNDCGPAAPKPPTETPACSGRRVVVHPRVPKGLAIRRVVVRVDGKVVRTLRGRVRSVRVDLRGRGRMRVELRVTGRRHGRTVTLRDRRSYRVCR